MPREGPPIHLTPAQRARFVQRAVPGQRLHRAVVAVAEVRGGVSSRAGRRVSRPSGPRGTHAGGSSTTRSGRREHPNHGAWNGHDWRRLLGADIGDGGCRTTVALRCIDAHHGRHGLAARRADQRGSLGPRGFPRRLRSQPRHDRAAHRIRREHCEPPGLWTPAQRCIESEGRRSGRHSPWKSRGRLLPLVPAVPAARFESAQTCE